MRRSTRPGPSVPSSGVRENGSMALVVLLKGVNVGGYRTFRPSILARQLKHLDVTNIGAAGTFVVRKRVGRATLRAEILRRLPFEAEVVICRGSDVLRLASLHPFRSLPAGPRIIRFVSVLAKRPRLLSATPVNLPHEGEWCVRIVGRHDRFCFGLHRREMQAIRYLGQLEKVFGVPVTTRNWNTILAIVRILKGPRNQ